MVSVLTAAIFWRPPIASAASMTACRSGGVRLQETMEAQMAAANSRRGVFFMRGSLSESAKLRTYDEAAFRPRSESRRGNRRSPGAQIAARVRLRRRQARRRRSVAVQFEARGDGDGRQVDRRLSGRASERRLDVGCWRTARQRADR